MLPKFSNEPGLIYRDMFVYPNNSMYRGQMKKRDENTKMPLSSLDNQSQMSGPGAMGRMSDGYPRNSVNDEESIMEFRHGYGI